MPVLPPSRRSALSVKRLIVVCLLTIGSICTLGCGGKQSGTDDDPSTAGVAGSDDLLERVRQTYPPGTIVGRIVDVSPDEKGDRVTVGDVPAQRLQPGDQLVFFDAGRQNVGRGDVVEVRKRDVVLRQNPKQRGARPPRAGDVAVQVSTR